MTFELTQLPKIAAKKDVANKNNKIYINTLTPNFSLSNKTTRKKYCVKL